MSTQAENEARAIVEAIQKVTCDALGGPSGELDALRADKAKLEAEVERWKKNYADACSGRLTSVYRLEAQLAEAREALRAAEFLCDRLGEFEPEFDRREYFGHVEPAFAWLRTCLLKASTCKEGTGDGAV